MSTESPAATLPLELVLPVEVVAPPPGPVLAVFEDEHAASSETVVLSHTVFMVHVRSRITHLTRANKNQEGSSRLQAKAFIALARWLARAPRPRSIA
jgi:hypothetical protein